MSLKLEERSPYFICVLLALHGTISADNVLKLGKKSNTLEKDMTCRNHESSINFEKIRGSKLCRVNPGQSSRDTSCCLVDFENYGNVKIHVSF